MAENQKLSYEEIEKLREVVRAADSKRPINVFDLSKPPVAPYSYKKFPKTVYDHKGYKPSSIKEIIGPMGTRDTVAIPEQHKSLIVHNQQELEKALKAGWKEEPFVPVPEEEETVA